MLVDDHALFRSGLRELLVQAGIRVIGEAASAEAGIDLVARLRPAVAVAELRLPGASGEHAIRRISEFSPSTRVLVLTACDARADVVAAVAGGACGYVLKDAAAHDIVSAVLAARDGQALVSPRIGATLFDELRQSTNGALQESCALSPRERDVLRLVVDGKSNAAIARELVISPHTVRNHVSSILLKLRADSRLEAAVHAVRHALV